MALLFNTFALALTAALSWFYLFGTEHSFFWIYPWFDMLLHFCGGLVMGLWACAVATRLSLRLAPAFWLISIIALLGGIGWEVFEYLFELQGGLLDTLSDLSIGMMGAYSALVLYALLHRFRI